MITYLNVKHNTQLRCEFYKVLPDVVSSIGYNSHSADVLGALIKQGLVDSDEIGIYSARECFISLIRRKLMAKHLALEIAAEAAPLLLYPNPGILISAATFFATLSDTLNTAERLVQLYPIIVPYFKKRNKAALDSATSILTFLRPPLTRSVYDLILVEFKTFSEEGKPHKVEEFIRVLPKDSSVDVDSIDLQEYKDYDRLLRRIRNAGKFGHHDIQALELMSVFIADQVRKCATHNAVPVTSFDNRGAAIDIERVELDFGKVRNQASLEPDQRADTSEPIKLWDK